MDKSAPKKEKIVWYVSVLEFLKDMFCDRNSLLYQYVGGGAFDAPPFAKFSFPQGGGFVADFYARDLTAAPRHRPTDWMKI